MDVTKGYNAVAREQEIADLRAENARLRARVAELEATGNEMAGV